LPSTTQGELLKNSTLFLDNSISVEHNLLMDKKKKKAQVVLAAIDHDSQNFQFLLLQTNEKRGQFWQNVTGKIEENETFEEGGLREAIEETQLKIESIVDLVDLGLNYDFVDQRKNKCHEKSFLIILDQKWDVIIDPKEHQTFKWVPQSEIEDGIVKFSSNFETLEKAKHLLKHWGV
jgi:8-oxo-dGTP pyrophosphatase MutT (NUDIX family)